MGFLAFPLDVEVARALGFQPACNPHAGEGHAGEDAGEKANDQHDREAADRAGAEQEQQHTGDEVGDVSRLHGS